MATKSIINIEVDDSQFKAFYEIFSKYQKAAGEVPDEINKATKFQKAFGDAVQSQLVNMRKMSSLAKDINKSILGIGAGLIKIGGLGAGLAGFSFFGLDILGRSAVAGQRQARGLGLNQGQVKAFKTDFSRFISDSILSSVAGAQNDLSKRAYLALATSTTYKQAGEMGVDQLAIKATMRANEWWNKTPASMRSEQTFAATGLPQIGMTMEDARRLGNTPRSELMTAQGQYGTDVKSLAISDKNTAAWYQLTRQVTLAGQVIETSLINKLQSLAPVLGGMVNNLTHDFEALVSGVSEKSLNELGDSIKSFAEYLGSPQTLQNFKDFGSAIMDVTHIILKAVAYFTPNSKTGIFSHDGFLAPAKDREEILKKLHAEDAAKKKTEQLSYLENYNKLPPGVLDSIWMQESARGKNKGLSKAGALGDFQFMPGTAKEYGITDRSDFSQEAFGAASLMHKNMIKYHGDMRKALAAYNWGSGHVDKDIAAHGAKWEQYAPKETQNYINQILARMKTPQVNVTITNKTGGNLYDSTNAMVH
jgi:hypothetical protein